MDYFYFLIFAEACFVCYLEKVPSTAEKNVYSAEVG
jgi:hypothetical protein